MRGETVDTVTSSREARLVGKLHSIAADATAPTVSVTDVPGAGQLRGLVEYGDTRSVTLL